MTVTMDRPAPEQPVAEAPAAEPPPLSRPSGASGAAGASRPAPHVSGTVLSLVGLLLLGFVGQVTLISQLRYERSQQTAYADFRAELAEGTAPVGQTDQNGQLHPLGTAVAVLRIPRLGLRQVVFEGTTSGVLEAGPGHRRDSALPGQAGTSVIMGRRAAYGGPFRDLDLLNTGDTITVATGQGEHAYRVLGIRRTGDIAPPPLERGAGRLTLITADGQPFVPDDLLRVDAELTSPAQPSPARPLGSQSLLPAEKAMAADPGAWTPIVLWGQLLLLAALAVAWLRSRWGGRQAWVVGVPVLGALSLTTADQVVRLLPNLL